MLILTRLFCPMGKRARLVVPESILKARFRHPAWQHTTLNAQESARVTRVKLLAWSVLFAGFTYWALDVTHTRQIKGTPLFKGVMLTLRHDPMVHKWIGTEADAAIKLDGKGTTEADAAIKLDGKVDGFINHLKGNAQLDFDIEGPGGRGHVALHAVKHNQEWLVKRLRVSVAGETIVLIDPQHSQLSQYGQSSASS